VPDVDAQTVIGETSNVAHLLGYNRDVVRVLRFLETWPIEGDHNEDILLQDLVRFLVYCMIDSQNRRLELVRVSCALLSMILDGLLPWIS